MNNDKLIIEATNKAKEVINDSKTIKSYNTKTLFESVFASMYKKFPLEQKEAHRELLNMLIAEEKKIIRIVQYEKNKKPNRN